MTDALFEIAEHTNRSIFLTGKAGTGKTTFLNNFTKKTKKNFIVVAPTGIAAINAGGVTIHSMFGLPLRTFIPTTDRIDGNLGMNIQDLMPHFKFRKDKLKLLREVEIIIIDEVSMLRADVLDMMDFALRHIRRNQEKFGGVQMLFIGDLYQLPPVVRDENFLKQYYHSPFFFDSLVLTNFPLITIELETVYRQKDEEFLDILNAIRSGDLEHINFEKLNERFDKNFEPKDEAYVYLTSHNRMADEINQSRLKKLPTSSFYYKAKITGEFRDNLFPNEDILELKVGAQIMFIRNDASGERQYFNGKLAEIVELDEEEIWVRMDGDDEVIKLKQEVWEQKKYSLDAQKQIKEDVVGSFQQFPIRLAWAVTIHKSQGLTFDRLIIDAGKSFASGQVYVALSRCRTLEGIVLKSLITPEVIFNDHRVGRFQDDTNANEKILTILEAEKYDYTIQKVLRKIDTRWIINSVEVWHLSAKSSQNIDKHKAHELYGALKVDAQRINQVYEKFRKILLQMTEKFVTGNAEWLEIESKSKGAVKYFFEETEGKIFRPLKSFYAETKGIKGLKAYNEDLKNFLDDLKDYLDDLQRLHLLQEPLYDAKAKKQISMVVEKVPTHVLSFQLFESGKTVQEIAKERGLVAETIIGHLAKYAEQGILDISKIIRKEKIRVFEKLYREKSFETLTEWKQNLPEDFEFGEIRILLNHHNYLKNQGKV